VYVMSEDGVTLLPFEGYMLTVNRTEHLIAQRIGDASDYWYMSSTDKEGSKQRLADFVEWLESPDCWRARDGRRLMVGDTFTTTEVREGKVKEVAKPAVYNFGKPIGAWKGVK
jgi:hypothetical protein